MGVASASKELDDPFRFVPPPLLASQAALVLELPGWAEPSTPLIPANLLGVTTPGILCRPALKEATRQH